MKALLSVLEVLSDLYWRFFVEKRPTNSDVHEAVESAKDGDTSPIEKLIEKGGN